jgi:hypothetical protein
MDQSYIDEVLGDLQREVLVKGSAIVADTLGVSDRTVRDLCPEQSRRHDEVTSVDPRHLSADECRARSLEIEADHKRLQAARLRQKAEPSAYRGNTRVVIYSPAGWPRLFETACIYRVYPTLDFILVFPTEDGLEIPELKAAAFRDGNSPYPLLAHNYVIVVVGSLPDSYLRSPALMERIRFSSRPLSLQDPGLDNSRQVIWSCPYPGIDV